MTSYGYPVFDKVGCWVALFAIREWAEAWAAEREGHTVGAWTMVSVGKTK